MSEKRILNYFWFETERLKFSANIPFVVDRAPTKLLLRSALSTVELVDVNDSTYAFVDDQPVGRVTALPNIPFVKKLIPKRHHRKTVEVIGNPQTAREVLGLCPDAKVYPLPDNKKVKVVIPL